MIRITRGSEFGGRYNSYKVFIDGVYCGKLRENETKEFNVGNGNHIVWARLDWRRSNKLRVDVKDSVVELEVSYAKENWVSKDVYGDLFHRILSWDRALWLREKGSAER